MNEANNTSQPQNAPGPNAAPGGSFPPLGGPAPAAPQPPIQTQVIYQQPVVAEPKRRRVGTFTLGLSLIMLGVMVPLSLIFHEEALRFLQFSPIVLVFLGIEVLYYAIRYKDGKLRYDGLSIFLVILLTVISLGASAVVPPITSASRYYREQSRARIAAEENAQEALDAAGLSGQVTAYEYFNNNGWYWYPDEKETYDWHTSLQIELDGIGGQELNTETVGDAFWKVASGLDRTQLYRLRIRLDDADNGWYEMEVRGQALQGLTRESLTLQTNVLDLEEPPQPDEPTEGAADVDPTEPVE